MIVTYFRSSSYNCYSICPNKFFIEYVLGIRSPGGKKADKGNVVHKALEFMAHIKLARQQGRVRFTDTELGEFEIDKLSPEEALDKAYHFYLGRSADKDWEGQDYKDCHQWLYDAMHFNNCMFNPLERDIVCPEQYFEFTIEQPWAEYHYVLPDGRKLDGHLGLKGSIDLVTKIDDKIYELIDWKTGARYDWGKSKDKTYEDLLQDPQLRMYHYALTRIYPNVDQIIVTIFYVRSGGPVSMCFTQRDVEETEKMLKKRFDLIRSVSKPQLVYPSRKCNWCWFKKNGPTGQVEDFSESYCQVIKRDVIQLGLDKVMLKHGKADAFNEYGSGGGRTNVD
jgi:hypothetical protein